MYHPASADKSEGWLWKGAPARLLAPVVTLWKQRITVHIMLGPCNNHSGSPTKHIIAFAEIMRPD